MILPSEVSSQFDRHTGVLRLFCAAILEDANDHEAAAALRASVLGDEKLACDFLKAEAQTPESGYDYSSPIGLRIRKLHEKLSELGRREKVDWYPWA